jgi:DnaJ-class molecular chaperone
MTGYRDNHYTVLGVAPTASPQEITHAFHRLVRRYHPDTDVNVDRQEPDALRAVIAAYQVLRDPARRADYDRRQEPPLRRGTAESPLRVGPVRFHGPASPQARPAQVIILLRDPLADDRWW